MMKPLILKSLTVAVIAISCATLGIGIGFIQGEIVARRGSQDEQMVFAASAGMVGGFIALFLGPILHYVLKRRISFEQFCYVVTFSLVSGCIGAWFLSANPNGPGWLSMFVTPIAAIILAVNFARGTGGWRRP